MTGEVGRDFHDVGGDADALVGKDVARQVFDEDVGHVLQRVLNIAVIVAELVDAVVCLLAFEQCLDVGEDHFFLVFEMLHHLVFVLVVEMVQHIAVFGSACIDNTFQMLLDVRESLVQIDAVRGVEVGEERGEVGVVGLHVVRKRIGVEMDAANEKEQSCADMVHLADFVHVAVAEAEPYAEARQQLQQLGVVGNQFIKFRLLGKDGLLAHDNAVMMMQKYKKTVPEGTAFYNQNEKACLV